MRCIGLMSGTSLDGVDSVVARWDADGSWRGVEAHVQQPFPSELRDALMALQRSGPDELHRAALAANALAKAYSRAVEQLLADTGLSAADIAAIGSHGQTVRHQPGLHDGIGYTCQLDNPALLAERTGIAVIGDFRRRDVAAGGQGAPLVPPFHQAVFGRQDAARAVVNIGGIANLTVLVPGAPPRGWDVGPGNVLMDGWIARHQGLAYDADGHWAAQGRVDAGLLAHLLSEPFLDLPPPKSTGRDLFHAAWLDTALAAHGSPISPEDVQATLCELSARTIAADVLRSTPAPSELLVCGGGALNRRLMKRLQAALPQLSVASTAVAGLPPFQVEAAAFAWLAHQHLRGLPGNEPTVTGARGPRILGAFYPA
ncbi:anhydro-N-acetylmuramic acid kinase [Leptothrix discophora]|uniref:Anhydro-N-acetylmuramic acid kinase n=1 Tax=Leptothrix discophora TaxID=89 RepID=A0ABT9G644_LEPDI|nr:anhydro-N-acetylmuramic acid kinase [Leptothrix discophora]MDP4301890.1 anhydro-N-acetylmuramic acid kinase [Leptothrix discophora]